MKSISETLKNLRISAGLSQKEAAEQLTSRGVPVSNGHISRWEKGANNPTIEQFIGLCGMYGISNVHNVFGSSELLGLEEDLNKDGIKRLREYRKILMHHPDYSALPAAAEGDGGSSAGQQVASERRLGLPRSPQGSFPLYTLGHDDPIALEQFRIVDADEFVPHGASFAVAVSGDAMHPVVRHGGRLWLEAADRLNPGEMGLVRLNGVLYVRVLDVQDGRFVLHAYNTAYRSVTVGPTDSFEILGRALEAPRPALASP